jgi:hypothetical protein
MGEETMSETNAEDPQFEEYFARRQKEDAEREFAARGYDRPDGRSPEELESYLRELWNRLVVKPASEGYASSEFGDGSFEGYVNKVAHDDFYKSHLMAKAYLASSQGRKTSYLPATTEQLIQGSEKRGKPMSDSKISRLLQPKVANDRDIAHEQISTSTDEQLAARLAEIEAYGKRTAINGLVGYHDDLRNELQGIKSEQYARANGLKTEPHVRYSGLPRQAAEEMTEEAPQNPTDKVLDFVAQNHTQVQKSEKEVPENFSDLRPVEGPIDPGYLFVPDGLSGSRTNNDAINIGNNRVFLKRYSDHEGVFPLTGDHGSFGVAIRISAITAEMLEDLKGMIEDYPGLDSEESSQAEHEQIDEAWTDWAHFDFINALGNHLPGNEEHIDNLDDDQARELFDRARRRIGAEWTQDSNSMFIDVVPVAEAVTPEDFDEPVAQAAPRTASVEPDYEAELAAANEHRDKARAEFQKSGPSRRPGVSFRHLLTKDQVLSIYRYAGMTPDKLPKKRGEETLLPVASEGVTIRITKSDKKSTYEKPLWLCEHVKDGKPCLRCGNRGRDISPGGICVDCLATDKPWDALTPGKGEEADDNF